jgi:hypothetical protein
LGTDAQTSLSSSNVIIYDLYHQSNMRFLVLLISSFVFLVSCTLALVKLNIPEKVEYIKPAKVVKGTNLPPLPVLTNNGDFPLFSAEGVLAVDLVSGVTLYAKNQTICFACFDHQSNSCPCLLGLLFSRPSNNQVEI